MDPIVVATIARQLGLDPVILSGILDAVGSTKVSVNPQAVQEYFPEEETKSFYLPSVGKDFYVPNMPKAFPISIPKNFYVNSAVGRKLVGL